MRRSWVTWLDVLSVLGLLAVLFVPVTPWTNIYCPVVADVESWGEAERVTTESWFGAPDHLVQDGRLLLRVQSTRAGLVLVTWVDAPGWDVTAIARYRADHPDLDASWPDPSLDGGGVRWLRK